MGQDGAIPEGGEAITPAGEGSGTDLLIRFFESQFFNAWIAITYLYKNLGPGTHDYLCNRLYTLPEVDIERYLSQLCQFTVLHPGDAVLERVLVDLCTHSLRVAVKTYWLLYAISQDAPGNAAVVGLRDRCEQAARLGDWELPFRSARLPSFSPPAHGGGAGLPLTYGLSLVHSPPAADLISPGFGRGIYSSVCMDSGVEGLLMPSSPLNPPPPVPRISQAAASQGDKGTAGAVATHIRTATHAGGGRGTRHLGESSSNGGGPTRMPPIFSPPNSPQRRQTTFGATLDLLEALCATSTGLLSIPAGEPRTRALHKALTRINADVEHATHGGVAIWFPLGPSPRLRVVRLAAGESQLLNSKDKAPFTVLVEVLKEEDEERPDLPSGLLEEFPGSSDKVKEVLVAQPPPPQTMAIDPVAAAAAAEGIPWVAHHHRRSSSGHVSFSDALSTGMVPTDTGSSVASSPESSRQRRSADAPVPAVASIGTPGKGLLGSVEAAELEAGRLEGAARRDTVSEELSTKLRLSSAGLDLSIAKRPGRVRHARTSSVEALHLVAKQHKLPLPPPTLPSPPATPSPASAPGAAPPLCATVSLSPESGDNPPTPPPLAPGSRAMSDTDSVPGLGVSPSPASTPASLPPSASVAAPQSDADAAYGEKWLARKARLRAASRYGAAPGWDLAAVIVKSGDDCRQELLAMQLITAFADIFTDAGLPLRLRPYEVLVTSNRTAVIEMVPNAPSLHSIKAAAGDPGLSLRQHLVDKFGGEGPSFRAAQKAFAESLAAYSLVCYLLQIKDRHNGNILLDDGGRLIHIDFGYMLSNSPGGVGFESAPFKLSRELVEVLDSSSDGAASELFDYFKVLMIQGFLAVRKHSDRITVLVDQMSGAPMPCFVNKAAAVAGVRKRLCLGTPEKRVVDVVLGLIADSLDAWSTRQYDYYQRLSNGIL